VTAAATIPSEALRPPGSGGKRTLVQALGWAAVLLVLAWAWKGADILDMPGNAGGDGSGAEGAAGSLSPQEEEYVRQYGDLLAAYKGQWTDIDLTGSLEPPRDLFIDVRVLKDAGEIQTEYG